MIDEHDVDIVMLAECVTPPSILLEQFNPTTDRPYLLHSDVSPIKRARRANIRVLARLPANSLRAIPQDNPSLVAIHLRPPVGLDIVLIVAHLPSKLHRDDLDQFVGSIRVIKGVERAESATGIDRTVMVGDFNMNPFEGGVAGGEGLHAVMSRTEALERSRVVDGAKRRFFFNPMWSRLGDDSRGPPGTYYHRSGQQLCYFWNTFDQVIIRPELLPFFLDAKLQVVTEIGTPPCVKASRPSSVCS